MADNNLKDKTAKGLLWGGLNSGSQQVLNLLFGILLARLLSPRDYGVVAMLTLFSAIANSLQESGFVSALVNRKNAQHDDYNAVFWFNVGVASMMYVLLAFCAPLIAAFYRTPELIPLSRVVFLNFVVSSMGVVPRAIMLKQLMVKQSAIMSFVALVVSGLLGVTLALQGCSYWGIAIQSLTFTTIIMLFAWRFSGWRPSFSFTIEPIRQMFGFSSKVFLTNLITILNANIFTALLGYYYNKEQVGFYNRANEWNLKGSNFVASMIQGVAQPVLVCVNDDVPRQLNVLRKMLRFTVFVSFPVMLGLSMVSHELIVIAIGPKWLGSVDMMRCLCIWGAFYPVFILFSNLLIGRGRSSVNMWLTLMLFVLQAIMMVVCHPYGIQVMIGAFVVLNILSLVAWQHWVRQEVGLTLRMVLADMAPFLLLSVASLGGAYLLTIPIHNIYILFVSRIVLSVGFYIALLQLTNAVIWQECLGYLAAKRHKQ